MLIPFIRVIARFTDALLCSPTAFTKAIEYALLFLAQLLVEIQVDWLTLTLQDFFILGWALPTKYSRFQPTVGNAHPELTVLRKIGRVTTRLLSTGSSPELAEGSSSKSLPASFGSARSPTQLNQPVNQST